MKLKVKKVHVDAKIPHFSIKGDAAMELYSVKDLVVKPGEIVSCETGIAMAIPDGYVGLIWDKSGIAVKGGVKTMGGVIDSNFRGQIGVIMTNLNSKDYKIKKGDKVAQILIQKIECPMIEEVEELDDTDRGDGRYGSTGMR